ncbi:hypothetical protein TanjilG_07416 [Lupinus angustifolius]|uniref:Enoyl-CoA hydratase n=1 Tax=Lupinus angustifolius TaxID=3871 RepID=A0A394DII4_LUPAN|nr:hypothetical protein TanjilG_07416 [Lupinus angustifolius]
MDRSSSENLILVNREPDGVAIVTINRPGSLNSLTRAMMGQAGLFCSGVDLTAAEDVFKGDVKDAETDTVVQMERCQKPIIGAVRGFAVTAGFEIALACDILVAANGSKFMDTHTRHEWHIEIVSGYRIGETSSNQILQIVTVLLSFVPQTVSCFVILISVADGGRFGIFPSWGLSQKLSRIIGVNKAREVSLTAAPLTEEVAERLGLVNHVVEEGELLKKSREIADAIVKNNQDMVLRYKSVINDGIKLDLGRALSLEKERAHDYYNGMTKEQFRKMQEFIASRGSKKQSKL